MTQSISGPAMLDRFNKVRRTRPDSWVCQCPAHEDKGPSLSIRQLADGRVLMRCFAGCGVEEILGAASLTFDDLFPEKLGDHFKSSKRPFPASDVLALIRREALIIAVAGSSLARRDPITLADQERLMLASERIVSACRMAGV